ncbi:hypothetical protein C8E00_10229 [Chromohalobacter marismortui]|uniref:Uncharacterized protein n=1 Tax=Chromohalobacter marismortui TaxID=42055 RepID=A0A4R7NS74_9GAMM|nr:hypothetical protein C8E00_10229 [Chromohalobacter marismortui]
MDDSLLVSLRRYRPREGRDSLEDYLTEIFDWLLRNSREVAVAFLDTVMRMCRTRNASSCPMPIRTSPGRHKRPIRERASTCSLSGRAAPYFSSTRCMRRSRPSR